MTTSESTSKLVAHEGVQIQLGSTTYVLPPMTLATRKKDIATRRAMAEGYDELSEQDLLLDVVCETLARNYPQITRMDLQEQADYPQLLEAYARLKEQEASLMAALGKRLAAAAVGPAET